MKQRRPINSLFVWGAAAALATAAHPARAGADEPYVEASGATAERSLAAEGVGARIAAAAIERTARRVVYDPSYVRLAYPGGDVAPDRGVCADLVIRVLRRVGLDLQQLVHEDMSADYAAYPQIWGLAAPDANIDHRRVPNIETFLTRKGARLAPSLQPEEYRPGDIVAWNLRGSAGALPHIGVVVDRIGDSGWPMVVHNIGAGPQLEDVLFAWPMTGRYRIDGAEGLRR